MYGPTDRRTDRIHIHHVYVGLAQAHPNNVLVFLRGYLHHDNFTHIMLDAQYSCPIL